MTLTIFYHSTHDGEDTFFYVLTSLAMLGFLVPDLHAVGWTALWRGVIARSTREAERGTFHRVLLLPWLAAFMMSSVAVPLAGENLGLLTMILSWMIFSAATNWWFTREARRNLETRLRLWALRRAAGEFENYDRWQKLGRSLGVWWKARRQSS